MSGDKADELLRRGLRVKEFELRKQNFSAQGKNLLNWDSLKHFQTIDSLRNMFRAFGVFLGVVLKALF